MRFIFQKAHKLFDKITHPCTCLLTPLFSFPCRNFLSINPNLDYPYEYSVENEDVVSWTLRISSLVKQNQPRDAFDTFKLMLMNEKRPSYVTILSVLRAIDAVGLENLIRGVHGLMIKMGFELEVSVFTALIGVYGSFDVSISLKLFADFPVKDLVMWSSMVSVCVKSGEYFEAIEIFREMVRKGVEPSYVSVVSVLPACAKLELLSLGKEIHGFSMKRRFYSLINVQNSLIDMYAKCGDLRASTRVFAGVDKKDMVTWKTIIRGFIENGYPSKALNLFSEMQSSRFDLDDGILCEVIGAASVAEQLLSGLGLHCYSFKKGFVMSFSVGTALLHMYAKFGLAHPSELIFEHICHKDLIAWSAMISAYAQGWKPFKALQIFKRMQSSNEKPNEITFVSLLQACSATSDLELGESIQGYVTKAGYLPNSFLVSALIDLYCKFGRIKQGRSLFDENPIKDLICWSSMINGYGINGFGFEALETFSNMINSGIRPNEVVFVSVLSACSHCGLEHEAWSWFHSMQRVYRIKPKLVHYACIVDLLSRQGKVQRALEFVYDMPMAPDKRIWASILSGCTLTRGSIEAAEVVVERLAALDPKNTSYYVVLSNLYAEEGRWEDAERTRQLIGTNGTRKTTGYSVIGPA